MIPILSATPASPERRGLTRRQLLVRGGLAAGGLIIAGVALKVAAMFERAAPGREVLSEREETILGKLIEALFPADAEMPAGDVEAMTRHLDHFLAHNDPDVRLLFKSLLHVIEDQATVLRFTRFTRLSLAERMEEVRSWELAPIYLKRAAFSSAKLLIGMAYFEQDAAAEAVGWYVGCAPPHLVHKSKNRLMAGHS
ncbi:MAG: hypothetical protein IT384_20550 [Deltaproteobacteria bacterium]|nr:hypothetical protein [Deltaproteobacteria bacterium]